MSLNIETKSLTCGMCGGPTPPEMMGSFIRCDYCGVAQFLEIDGRFREQRDINFETKIGKILAEMAGKIGVKIDCGVVPAKHLIFRFFGTIGGEIKPVGEMRFYDDLEACSHYELCGTGEKGSDLDNFVVVRQVRMLNGTLRYHTEGLVPSFKGVVNESELSAGVRTPVTYVLGKMLENVALGSFEEVFLKEAVYLEDYRRSLVKINS